MLWYDSINFNNLYSLGFIVEGRNFRRVQWGYHPLFQNIDAISV
jgi:hypothetical protein